MGYIWHDRRVDFGIDGEIELRDAATGAALNLIVLVQSKASDRPFARETATSFDYLCEERDLAYWLGGNAPVLLVCSHPGTDEAWWVSIKEWFSGPGRRAERRVHFDKRSMRFDASAAGALLDIADPVESGLYLVPLPRNEQITSNLLRLVEVPPTIYTAPSLDLGGREAVQRLKDAGVRERDFLLYAKRLYSFRDPRQPPFDLLVGDMSTDDIKQESTASWAISDDPDRLRRYADLLTRTLRAMLHEDLAWEPVQRCLYFKSTHNLRERRIRNSSGRSRVVFKAYRRSAEDPDKISYCRHDAFIPRFTRVEGTWYLVILPTNHYTWDGHKASLYGDELRSGLRRLERNRAVFGQVKMWANYLQGGGLLRKESPLGFGHLAAFDVDRGIDESRWRIDRVEGVAAEGLEELDETSPEANQMADVEDDDVGFGTASLFDGEDD